MIPARPKPDIINHSEMVVMATQSALDRDTSLRITVYNSASNIVINVAGDYYSKTVNDFVPFQEQYPVASTRAAVVKTIQLSDGYLSTLRVSIGSGTARSGQCWCVCEIVKSAFVSFTILNGYVVSGSSISFPYNQLTNPFSGNGFPFYVQYADPAPGNPFTTSVPTNAIWLVDAFPFELVTNATAGNRNIVVAAQRSGFFAFQAASATSVPASSVYFFDFENRGGQVNTFTSGGIVYLFENMPSWLVAAGQQISINVFNIQIGDQLSSIAISGTEWIYPT